MSGVITHPEMGVYLGSFLGLGFWTLLDTAGQPHAATFASQDEARDHIRSWESDNDPDKYRFVDVTTDEHYATVAHLEAAGLGDVLGDMRSNARR